MRSSYIANDYGRVFYGLVEAYRSVCCVELGVLDGYSAIHIAKGLKFTHERFGLENHLDAYDLWEDYRYAHGELKNVQKLLESEGLEEFLTLHKGDAFEVHKNYENKSVSFLHVDISNDGEVLERIMGLWHPKMRGGGIIAFEGGSKERDKVDWMVKYKKKPIYPVIYKNKIINKYYVYGTYKRFPSLTVMLNKFG